MTFGVVVEPNKRNAQIWIAKVPLLPGCNAIGSGMQDVLQKTELAIQKYFRRHAKLFPLMPRAVKCRMISKDEYEQMTDTPLTPTSVLVGANQSVASSR